MNFLAPLFLIGTFAVALPVIYHLVRRSSREQFLFSSLMFLTPSPPRLTRRSRLDQILLLLMRCLVLCLLALGFARPFLKRPMAANSSPIGNVRTLILLDASASMRREELWARAIARAEAHLRKLAAGDQASVVIFDGQSRPLVSFAQWAAFDPGQRVETAVQRLREVKPGWGGTALGSALVSAVEAMAESDRREHQEGLRRIVLISDLQEGAKLDGLQGFEWPRGVEVVVDTLQPKNPTNAGIQCLNDPDTASVESVGFRVRVSNSSDAKREQFQVRTAGEKTIGELYVPPGQSRILPVADESLAGGERLLLSGDDAEFDNTFYLIPPRKEKIKVLFLGEEKDTDSTQTLFYLKRAFAANARQQVEVITRNSAQLAAPTDFAVVEFAIVSDSISEERAGFVRRLLEEGKTLLLILKSPASSVILAKIAGAASVAVEEASASGYAMLGQIDFQHPLFAPFADPRFSDFTKIHFWKHRRIRSDQFPGVRVLAKFDGPEADPAVLQMRVGAGQLFIFTFGWFPSDSQLALSSKFVPLLHSFLELSGAVKAQSSQYLVGDPVDLSGLISTGELTLRKPDGTETKVPSGGRFLGTEQPGIYEVTSVQPPFRFAVNLASEESRTAPLPVETLERLGVPMKVQPSETAGRAGRLKETRQMLAAAELEGRQKLWRWLIVAALVVLMIETWFAGRLTRPGAPEREAST